MAANDFRQFHELAEQFKNEMSLKKICEQEGAHIDRITHGVLKME